MARQRLLSALKLFCLVAAGAGVAIVATQSQADGRVVGLLLVLAALLAVVIAAVVTGAAPRTGAGRTGPRSWSRDDDDWQRRSDDPLAVVSAMTALSVATGATCDDGRPADPSGGACHGADSSASYGSDSSCGADSSSSYGSDASSSCGSDSSSF
jgi:hypothetical protein